jgi:hypothetical protein
MHEQARRERQQELLLRAQREAKKCTYTAEMLDKLSVLAHEASDSNGVGLKLLEAGEPYAPTCPIEGGEPGCQSYVELIERLLFEQRAMLPPSVFGLMHDIRTVSVAFEASARRLSEAPGGPGRGRELERLREHFELADGLYGRLVAEVRGFLDGFARAS